MAKLLTGTRIYGTGTIDTQLFINGSIVSSSTLTGALVVTGGVGIGGDLRVGGTIYGTISGAGAATTATNLAGGSAGQVPYQTAPGLTSFYGPGTAGQILLSAGAAAPVYTNTASVYVGAASSAVNLFGGTAGQFHYQSSPGVTAFISTSSMYVNRATIADSVNSTVGSATTATNLAGGTAGQLHYQSAPGITAFAGPGTAGQLLVSAGAAAPVYTNTASIYVGAASSAVNLFGGLAGQIHYQSAANTTAFVNSGTSGQFLQATTNGAPVWTNTGSMYVNRATIADSVSGGAGTATTATNIAGGTAGQVHYQTAPGLTSFFGPGTAGQLLVSAGAAAPVYTNTSSIYVQDSNVSTNIRAGISGQLHYQSAPNTTAFVNSGTTGQFLQATTNGAPAWTNTGSMYVNRATIADSASGSSAQVNTIAQTANAVYYPTFVDTNNASSTAELVYTTSSFTINPATGNVGIGTNTVNTNGILQVNGTIGLAPNAQIRQWTNADSGTLQFFGTQVVVGPTNSVSYSYTEAGLLAGVSNSDSQILLDTGRANTLASGWARFRVVNQAGPHSSIQLSRGTTSTFYAETTNAFVGVGYTAQQSGAALNVNGGVYVNGTVTATNFVGNITGTITGAATQVNTIAQTANATYYPAFVDSNNASSTSELVYTTSSFTINPQTGAVGINSIDSTWALTVKTTGVLGGTAGNFQKIWTTQAVGGSGGNNVYTSEWRRRKATGTDWITQNIHDGIWVDASFTTPGVDTRTWWERDPNTPTHTWGDQATTWLTLNATGLGIGTTPASKLHVSGDARVSGITTVSNTTSVSSTVTGAFQVAGGAGLGGGLFVGGIVTATNMFSGGSRVLTLADLVTSAILVAGTDTAVSGSTGVVTIWNTGTLQTITNRGSTTTNAINITNATAAISTATGALQVRGGVGIGGDVYAANIYTNNTRIIPTSISEFTATAGQNIFTIAGGYVVGTVQVFANGLQLGSADFTASNGSTVTLAQGRTVGDTVRFVAGVLATPQIVDPAVLNDISSQFDGYKAVFPLKLDQTSISNIVDSKDLEVVINGQRLSPYVDEYRWPWITPYDSYKGFRVVGTNLIIYNAPWSNDSSLVILRGTSSVTRQKRRYPYSATSIALGD